MIQKQIHDYNYEMGQKNIYKHIQMQRRQRHIWHTMNDVRWNIRGPNITAAKNMYQTTPKRH